MQTWFVSMESVLLETSERKPQAFDVASAAALSPLRALRPGSDPGDDRRDATLKATSRCLLDLVSQRKSSCNHPVYRAKFGVRAHGKLCNNAVAHTAF